ncbi:hypothetical protein QWZ14_31695 [Paeniroseomonas aquatica]|uniref:Porin n=1 Tax=Paeniroseomonas aquatica TaxID=373043 RepID=A0ABT8AGT9_9PROT|nr:hypothetical protein [Paeniroseomonas aquatica]MDN3568965.1 hypothetical protein [Paeniroseomonas aquatica]
MPSGTRSARTLCLGVLASLAGMMPPAQAQTMAQAPAGDAATIAELRRQLEDMRRRLEQLETRSARRPPAVAAVPAPPRPAPAPAPGPGPAPAAEARAARDAAREARTAADQARVAQQDAEQARQAAAAVTAPVQGLDPPEPMGRQNFAGEGGDALRADLPGIAFRVPGAATEVRLYGFAKLTAFTDANGRNQTDAPAPALIPLTGSAADRQGGEFGMGARFSRFGVDTRTLTGWGTLETRIEGDFGGGAPTSPNAVFRLRQAWAELGTPAFRVLVGQANSLWNEGLFETIIDATNLNQSFVRQAQLRITGRLAPGLTGQASLEAPETSYVSGTGLFTPGSSLNNGASPAFNAWPDLLGRLTYADAGWEFGLRGLLRNLRVETAGTAATGGRRDATAWGFAGHVRMPLRILSPAFGSDELVGMAFYGEGIGRYFFGGTGGQDATSNIGLASAGLGLRLDPLPAWGMTAAWRRFWLPPLRSSFAYSYARQDYPGYALEFAPGSTAALSLNRELHQAFANLIWSPFAEARNGSVSTGWLDIGLEYLFTRRDLFGAAAAGGPGGVGHGIANRVLVGAIARF